MRFIFFLCSFIVTSSFAYDACKDVLAASLSLSLHAFNIANANTTRTPDRGTFKRKELEKKNGNFEVISVSDFKKVYLPTHPDADSSGVVTLPNIDLRQEKAGASAAAVQLRILGKEKVCGVSLHQDANSFFVRYTSNKDIQMDTFLFSDNGELKIWTRRLVSGQEQSVTF